MSTPPQPSKKLSLGRVHNFLLLPQQAKEAFRHHLALAGIRVTQEPSVPATVKVAGTMFTCREKDSFVQIVFVNELLRQHYPCDLLVLVLPAADSELRDKVYRLLGSLIELVP